MEQTKEKPVKEKSKRLKAFLAGIVQENPVLVGLLGMCPTLATTKSLESAFGMGILVILTLIGSNVLISLLRKIIPAEVKIPCYIVIIATFVTIIKMFAEAFLPELYASLGVFISLIVVNCIILGRAESFASKNGPLMSLLDALGMGIGFTMALCIMGIIREILGTGGLTFGVYFTFIPYVSFTPLSEFAIKLFVLPAGGFLTLGSILAVMAFYKNHKEEKKLLAEKKRIEELKAKKAAELAAKQAQAKEDK
ncbi:MAG: electron transport complex subunit E [Anaeroplasmataceae bacterium]|nr:electron transport complex subunit E [Anaeroplasmataceae bacterium]